MNKKSPIERMLLPIYQERGKTYRADACLPLMQGAGAGDVDFHAIARGHYPGKKLPANVLPGLKTVGFWDADHPQNWGLDWHRNEGIELTFLESGSVSFSVEGAECQLQPDDLAFTRPWQRHRLGDPNVGAGRLHWIILDVGVHRPHQAWRWPPWLVLMPADRRELTTFLRQTEQPVWRVGPEIRRCFQKIAQAVLEEQLSHLAVFLNELFVRALERFRREQMPLDESLSSARRTVELFWNDLRQNDEFLGREWTVVSMARRCGMGVTHFIHQTKQLVNRTPGQYLMRCRLEAAARLLSEEPDRSVTEIALRCGFGSSQYFATQFRRHFSKTPRDFRRPS